MTYVACMEGYLAEIWKIKKLLKTSSRGMTVQEVANELKIGRNSAAKYLDILRVSGQVEMESIGPAKLFRLSNRVPPSKLINYSSDCVVLVDDKHNILHANNNFLNMFCLKENIVGKNIKTISAINSKIISELDSILNDGKCDDDQGHIFIVDPFLNVQIIPTLSDIGSSCAAIIMENVGKERSIEEKLKKYRSLIDQLIDSSINGSDLEKAAEKINPENNELETSNGGTFRKQKICRAIIDSLPDMIFLLKPDGTFIDYISSDDSQLYVPPSEFMGKKISDVLPEKVSHSMMQYIKKVEKHGSIEFYEYQLSINNKICYYEARFVPGKNEDVLLIVSDITSKKLNENRLESIFRLLPVAAGITTNRVFREVNPRMLEMTGYTIDELIGSHASMLYLSPEISDYVGVEKYGRILENGIGNIETQWKRKDGTVIDVVLSSTPLDISDLSKGFTFTAMDITEKKNTVRSLKLSEEKFRHFFNKNNDYCYMVSPDGKIIDINESALKVLEYQKEDIIGKPIQMIYAQESVCHAKDIFDRWLSTGIIEDEEVTIISKSGEKRNVLLNCGQMADENGNILHSISIQKEIGNCNLLKFNGKNENKDNIRE